MQQLTRKQREILERNELILNVSRSLFHLHGYHNVTMDLIAKEVEYSKGTIYQHFASKEALICALCLRTGNLLLSWFEKINEDDSVPGYVKMLKLMEAQVVIHDYASKDHDLLKLFKSQSFASKLDHQILEGMNCNLEAIIKVVYDIVRQAEQSGELIIRAPASIDSITLGCWAMIEGTHEIADQHSYGEENFTTKQIKQLLTTNCMIFLRGSGWHAIPFNSEGQFEIETQYLKNIKNFKSYCRKQIDELHQSAH